MEDYWEEELICIALDGAVSLTSASIDPSLVKGIVVKVMRGHLQQSEVVKCDTGVAVLLLKGSCDAPLVGIRCVALPKPQGKSGQMGVALVETSPLNASVNSA
eukprot:TRINITY_DN86768_c0_g1_i1.p3 TRINITY_DN86768_c0_g1~~TRINITY_DN86768_c0_g1_i1.p3  ORF type:complete len:103 (+),score=2.61 TRINITY_DN86768_c0_g1_i1:162-470(+)